MESRPGTLVKYAEKVGDGVVITFEDGQHAFFSGELLYSKLSEALKILEPEDETYP